MGRMGSSQPSHLPVVQALAIPDQALAAFDARAAAWEDYVSTPLGRLRQELTLQHLAHHLGSQIANAHVLDMGGGTGGYALALAQQGCHVCLLDFSEQMLDLARRNLIQGGPLLTGRMDLVRASAHDLPALFPPEHFDAILCHTLLEYVTQPLEVLRAMVDVLRADGLFSLLFVNLRADPLRWALAKGDMDRARSALHEPVSTADLFDLPRHTFTVAAIQDALTQLGMVIVAEYGVRIFADYLDGSQLDDPCFYAQLVQLEIGAGSLSPYKQIARYSHVVARKSTAL